MKKQLNDIEASITELKQLIIFCLKEIEQDDN